MTAIHATTERVLIGTVVDATVAPEGDIGHILVLKYADGREVEVRAETLYWSASETPVALCISQIVPHASG